MSLPQLISFSGRKGSGKTELAKVCTKYGYILINFADSLKDLVSKCLDISKNELECWKDEQLTWDLSKKVDVIAKELEIKQEIIETYCKNSFVSIRQILQILGTDVIRKYNPDWHVNKTIHRITNYNTKRFCIGDCRFKNEKNAIEALGGECWFVIRPGQVDISNHQSEVDLNWSFFGDKVIINSMDRYNFILRWNNYLYKRNLGLETEPFINNNLINFSFLYPNEKLVYLLGFFRGSDIMIKNNVVTIENEKILRVKILKEELGKDYSVRSVKSIDIYNPYIIENLKLWNIFNNKDEIPDKIKMDEILLKWWVVGLIDSSGIVVNNALTINLSTNIFKIICKKCNIDFDKTFNNTKNLYNKGVVTFVLEKHLFMCLKTWLGDIRLIEKWGNLVF